MNGSSMERARALRGIVLAVIAMLLSLPGSTGLSAQTSDAGQATAITADTVHASEDAYVNESAAGSNYGNSPHLYVSKDASLHERFALLRFDFSGIPEGSIITSARFYAYLRGGDGASPARLSVHWVVGDWTEGTVTWNNKPATVLTGHFRDVSTVAGWRFWDVTDGAQCWADRDVLCTDASLALRAHPDFDDAFLRDFDSSEGPNRPYLQIEYSAPRNCSDTGATNPSLVRINVYIESASGSASIDGDNLLFDNEADLYPQVSINGGGWIEGPQIDGDDTPHFRWEATAEVPWNIGAVPIRIRLWDEDEPWDPNNVVDLDPTPGDDILDLSFDLCAYAFSDDGAGQGPACEGGICRGGVLVWLGPGNRGEHASVFARIETANHLPISDVVGDVAVTGLDFVQIVDEPNVAVANRGSILRVRLANTYPYDVQTVARAYIGDAIGPEAVEEHAVQIPSCDEHTENFFVTNPVVVEHSIAQYHAIVDPLGLLTPTGAPACVHFNNGSTEDPMGGLPIHITRDISVVYQRVFHWDDRDWDLDLLSEDGALAEAAAADVRMRGFFPSPELDSSVDPIPLPIPFRDPLLGPRTEIQAISDLAALLGVDRAVGLVPNGWVDRHGYPLLPDGTTGVSNGKIGPHFVIAEASTARDGFIPVHELGHTFGLSDEPCDSIILWECEDEYNTDAFPTRPPGGFPGRGFDVPRGLEAAGICFMDNEEDAWISNNDFESFVGKLQPGADPRVLVASGFVTSAGGGELAAAVGRPDGVPDRNSWGRSPFALRVRDANGATLGEYGIFADMQGDDSDGDGVLEPDELLGDLDGNGIPDALPVSHPSALDENGNGIADAAERAEFSLRIPWPPDGQSLALVGPHGEVIDTLAVAEQALPIELLEPVGEIQLLPGDLLPVRWRLPGQVSAVDAAGGPQEEAALLGVAIAASYDDGQTWLPRATGLQGSAFVIDGRGLEQPVNVQIRVLSMQNGMAGIDTVAGDMDGDRCPDPLDPAPTQPDTVDSDGDGIPDVCDRCLSFQDPLQTDADQDGQGDACDADYNNDGRVDNTDFHQFFQPCVGASVVSTPECYDKDRDRNGTVTAEDFCIPAPWGLCNDGNPYNGAEICSPIDGCQPGTFQPIYLPLVLRRYG